MKKIFLLGRLNEVVKDLEKSLGSSVQVQICPMHAESFREIIQVVKPDLFLISLVGLYDDKSNIFTMIRVYCPDVPVLTIGNEYERKNFADYYKYSQFMNVMRPVDNRTIIKSICLQLDCGFVEKDGVYELVENDRKKLVLVVDDNATMLRTIKGMLEEEYEVAVANSGMKALTQMGKKRPNLILLDYEMPICDGKQTLEMIRDDEEFKDIPVIFLTGVSDRAHIQAVVNLKPAGYLLKPITKDLLLDAVREKASS